MHRSHRSASGRRAVGPSSHTQHTTERNWLLRSLPEHEYQRIVARMDLVTLVPDQVIHDAGQRVSELYFPEDCVLSLICCPPGVANGIEVAVVGPEGFVGLSGLRGVETTVLRCLVQVPGRARRLSAAALADAVPSSDRMRTAVTRFAQALFDQVAMCAACNVGHSPRQRCARWLLMLHDRIEGDEFPATQKFLGYMLGLSRQTMSDVARGLQEEGLITYRRGRVRIVDRRGLEQVPCECYAAMRQRTLELLGRLDAVDVVPHDLA